MIDSLVSILALTAIGLSAYALGRPLARTLCLGEEEGVAAAVWSLAIGLVAAGTLWAVLGQFGLLYWWLIAALTAVGSLAGMAQIAAAWVERASRPHANQGLIDRLARSAYDGGSPPADGPPPYLLGAAVGLAAIACLGALVAALAPPTAGDALCYHLDLPKRFLDHHGLVYFEFSDHSTYPLLTEMWYLWALALEGPVTAQLVHWALGILLALAAVVLATPLLGSRWAWLVGPVVLFVPGVTNQMTAPLVDVAVAVPTTLALAAWRRGAIDRSGRRWYVVAGLMLGAALAIKYSAILFAAAVACTALWQWAREKVRRRELVLAALTVAALSFSVAGIWYARAAWHHGNPVYPFFDEVAGGDGPAVLRASKRPLGYGPLDVLRAPWAITLTPEKFGGRGHRLGGLWLVGLPVLVTARRLRGLRSLLAVACLYAVGWYVLRQNVRFLYPVVPLAAVALVWAVMEMRRYPAAPRFAAMAVLAGLAAVASLMPLIRAGDKFAVAVGLERRDAHLIRTEPTYACALLANRVLPAEAKILSQDFRAFYFDRDVVREAVFRRRTHYDRHVAAGGNLLPWLEARGITHLLLASTLGEGGIRYNTTLWDLAESQQQADPDSLSVLIADRFADSDGAVRHYRLVEIR